MIDFDTEDVIINYFKPLLFRKRIQIKILKSDYGRNIFLELSFLPLAKVGDTFTELLSITPAENKCVNFANYVSGISIGT